MGAVSLRNAAILEKHASHVSIFVAFHARPSLGSLEESLSSLESGNLLRCEDAADWVPGVLGVCVARTLKPVAFSQVDGRDGTLRASQDQESLITERAGPAFFHWTRSFGQVRFLPLPEADDSEGTPRARRS